MKRINAYLTLLIFALTAPFAAYAENEEEAVDDITVIGQKSLSELRRDAYKAEEEFYDIYNGLNDDDEFDVRCFYEKPTGTRQRNHVCRAKFVTTAYSRHAARNGNDLSRIANQDGDPAFAQKTAVYQTKLETLITENEELAEAFVRYNTALTNFMAKREALGKN